MATYSTILVTRDKAQDSVAILTLNRPEALNSFNKEMVRDLISAYKDLDACLLYTSPSPRD